MSSLIPFQKSVDWPAVNLYILADWHWGHPNCRVQDCKEVVKLIKNDKHAFWIGGGDLMENALTTSLGDIYEQLESPNQQLMVLKRMFTPIKDKCLGMAEGNHEARSKKAAGIKIDQILATLLGVHYFGDTAIGQIKVQRLSYIICFHHTTGAPRTAGGKINNLKKLAEIYPLCDIYIGAHDHSQGWIPDRVFYLNTNSTFHVQGMTRHYFKCGKLMDYHHSYASFKMMPPMPHGQLRLTLGGKQQRRSYVSDGKRYESHRNIKFTYVPQCEIAGEV